MDLLRTWKTTAKAAPLWGLRILCLLGGLEEEQAGGEQGELGIPNSCGIFSRKERKKGAMESPRLLLFGEHREVEESVKTEGKQIWVNYNLKINAF